MPNTPKTDKVDDALHKAHDIAEIGEGIPLVGGRVKDAEDIIEIAEEGKSLFKKFGGLFKKKYDK